MSKAYVAAAAAAVTGAAAWFLLQPTRIPVLLEFRVPAGALSPLGVPDAARLPGIFQDARIAVDSTYLIRPALPLRGNDNATFVARVHMVPGDIGVFAADRANDAQLVAVHSDPQMEIDSAKAVDAACTSYDGKRTEVDTLLSLTNLHGDYTGEDVLIVVVDTGLSKTAVQTHHPDVKWDCNLARAEKGKPGEASTRSHGTMAAYTATIAAPKATITAASSEVGDTRLDYAYAALVDLSDKYRKGELKKYRGVVITNSWGVNVEDSAFRSAKGSTTCDPKNKVRSTDSPCHIFNLQLKDMGAHGFDVVFAATNSGICAAAHGSGRTGTIRGANSLTEVLTVGAVDLKNRRLPDSGQGPGITDLGEHKPDVVMYSRFSPDPQKIALQHPNGTSAAAGVAAGVIAAIRTKISPSCLSPAALRTLIRETTLLDVKHAEGGKESLTRGDVHHDFGAGVISVSGLLAKLPECGSS